ncbi:MAG: cytochrome P450 [Actinomycetes bacterium]
MQQPVVHLSTWNEARDALRHRDLRQGLYDEGNALMDGVIVNLHGADHLARRRLENRLFRRDTFLQWEQQLIPQLINDVFNQLDDRTEGNMVQIARRTMMRLSSLVAGIDIGADLASFEKMSGLMAKLAAASTVVHATGNKQEIIDEGNAALSIFLADYFSSSRLRREELIVQAEKGVAPWSELPADVLTVLLTNKDNLDLPDEVIAREIAYFPWVGSHSTSAALVHALHHCFTWESEHQGTLSELATNAPLLQRFVHESLRLHPASPEATRIATADVVLPCGVHIPAGATVAINMVSANRDPEIFGPSADVFDPYRTTPAQASRWGLTFGTGFHACLGQELAGGLGEEQQQETPLYGAIVVMLQAVLQRGGTPHHIDQPELDVATRRPVWKHYPVSFSS